MKILNKSNELVRFNPNRAQRHLLKRLTGRDLILKARQLGFSTVIRAVHEVKAMTETSRLATLAHDQDTTDMLRRMSKRYWEQIPDGVRPERGFDNASTTTYTATGSEVIIKTAGSRTGGRGGTLSDVHGSEVAFWKDAKENMRGIMQAVPINGSVILESTPNGATGWFYDQCMKALKGKGIWTLHFYEWWWADEYMMPLDINETLIYSLEEYDLITNHGLTPEQIKWRRYKIEELGSDGFRQEYPEDVVDCFIASGNQYFTGLPDSVFKAPMKPIYVPDHRYWIGMDFGQSNDYTVGVVLDETAGQQVDLVRVRKQKWDEMRGDVTRLAEKWNANIIAETNSAGSNIEDLRNELPDHLAVIEFTTTSKSKPRIIQKMKRDLQTGALQLQDIKELKAEVLAFISKKNKIGWSYEGGGGEHDDIVMSIAIGNDDETRELMPFTPNQYHDIVTSLFTNLSGLNS